MSSTFINKLISLFVPTDNPPQQLSERKGVGHRQRILDRLREHFLSEMDNETTTESLLYPTSFTVYVPEAEYESLAPGFARTARDAVNVFMKEIEQAMKDYPDHRGHSRFWELQLVALPDGAEIEGIDSSQLYEDSVIIKSKLFADDNYDSRIGNEGRCVVTLHSKNSAKQIPNALNLASLQGLTELSKDKYRIEFTLGNVVPPPAPPVYRGIRLNPGQPETPCSPQILQNSQHKGATLHIVDGDFLLGDRKFRVYNMTEDRLLVSGKYGAVNSGVAEVHINDENVLSPVLEISRDCSTGRYMIKTWGEVILNGRHAMNGVFIPLSNNSRIMINEDYQINFKIN